MTDRVRDDAPLAGRAAAGAAWQLASYGLTKSVLLIVTVVLARLLVPEHFGLVALALVIVTYLEVVADVGVGHGLVHDPGDSRRVGQAITLSVIAAALMASLTVAVAPILGAFFGRSDVVPLVRVLALSLLFSGLAQVPDALLRRELRFSRRLLTEVARSLVQALVSVLLALNGAGAWALALGYVAGQGARCVTAWTLVKYRPTRTDLRPDRATVSSLLSFGAASSGAALFLTLVHDVDYLIVGKVRGATDLGHYSLAFRLPQTIVITVYWAISSVTFPVFARLRNDPDRVRTGYLRWIQAQALYGMPAGAVLAVLAATIVPTLFGPKWIPAVGALQALGVYSAVRSLSSGAFEVFKGVGRPRLAMVVGAVALVLTVPALVVAAHSGIAAVGWTQVGLTAALGVVVQVIGTRLVGLRPAQLARSLVAPMAATVAAAGTAAVLVRAPGPALVRLGLAVVGALVAGAAAASVADPEASAALRSAVGRTQRRVRSA